MHSRSARMTQTLSYAALAFLFVGRPAHGQFPASPSCRPFEVVAPGRRASDSVRIGNRLVARTQNAVRDAWQATGVPTASHGYGFYPGERVLIYRDSQPRGSAIYDGCTLVPEQLPLPTHWQSDAISNIEILPSKTVA